MKRVLAYIDILFSVISITILALILWLGANEDNVFAAFLTIIAWIIAIPSPLLLWAAFCLLKRKTYYCLSVIMIIAFGLYSIGLIELAVTRGVLGVYAFVVIPFFALNIYYTYPHKSLTSTD
jgi:hypothetical protein